MNDRTKTGQRYTPRPSRGEERRDLLLAALRDLLAKQPLAEIAIADLTERAGVSRSAFYVYFATKAAAVGALLDRIFDDMNSVAADWNPTRNGTGHHGELARSLRGVVGVWREHASLITAVFDALGTDRELRTVWDGWFESSVEQSAALIAVERRTGAAPEGVDPVSLARALTGMNVKAMERDVRAIVAGEKTDDVTELLTFVWDRTVYGRFSADDRSRLELGASEPTPSRRSAAVATGLQRTSVALPPAEGERYVSRPSKGETRRTALLAALEELLKDRSLAEIGVSDITDAAGVTRPAFYFYFATKQAAVGALLDDLLEDVDAASARDMVTIPGAMAVWRAHPHLLVATLDAAASDPEVRAVWRAWMDNFVRNAIDDIELRRQAGRARPGPPANRVARVLSDVTEAAMDRDVRRIVRGESETEDVTAVLVEIWRRALFAS